MSPLTWCHFSRRQLLESCDLTRSEWISWGLLHGWHRRWKRILDDCKMTNQPAEAHFLGKGDRSENCRLSGHIRPLFDFDEREIQFALNGIATRHDQVLLRFFASVDQNAAQHLADIIAKPPEGPNKYEILRRRLLQPFQPNLDTREETTWPTVASNPQHWWAAMLTTMLGDAEPNFICVRLCLEQLPENIRNVLMQKKRENQYEILKQKPLQQFQSNLQAV